MTPRFRTTPHQRSTSDVLAAWNRKMQGIVDECFPQRTGTAPRQRFATNGERLELQQVDRLPGGPDLAPPLTSDLRMWDALEGVLVEVIELPASAEVVEGIRCVQENLEGSIPQRVAGRRKSSGMRGWGWRLPLR